MLEENTHSLIIRLFSGEASPDEKRQVRDWLIQSDNNQKMYADLQEIWLAANSSEEYNTEQAISRFKEQVTQKKVKVIRIAEFIKYAAILLLLISLPLVYFQGKKDFAHKQSYTTVTCAFGDKSTVALPDGSLVNLNSGSKLTFNNDFVSDYREVSLEGEAYFVVAKNEEMPFKVMASEIEIQVLGTEFNLKAYPNEDEITATLVEGSIEISSDYQQTVMKPSQKVVYNRDQKNMKLFSLKDVVPDTEWKEGRLVFRNESLEELELKLERWFDVDIEFADKKVKTRRFTGILERESILEAISYFNFSDQVGYEINDNEITFFSK